MLILQPNVCAQVHKRLRAVAGGQLQLKVVLSSLGGDKIAYTDTCSWEIAEAARQGAFWGRGLKVAWPCSRYLERASPAEHSTSSRPAARCSDCCGPVWKARGAATE